MAFRPFLFICLFDQILNCVISSNLISFQTVICLVASCSRSASGSELSWALYAIRVVAFQHQQDLYSCNQVSGASQSDRAFLQCSIRPRSPFTIYNQTGFEVQVQGDLYCMIPAFLVSVPRTPSTTRPAPVKLLACI